ncbi:MAG TPA: hypothetical protein VGI86_04785 [Acidimicrobiia bacterium]
MVAFCSIAGDHARLASIAEYNAKREELTLRVELLSRERKRGVEKAVEVVLRSLRRGIPP